MKIPKNLIICLIDAAAADHLGCYGYSKNTTAGIDEIAREGVLFENAFTQIPSTLPAVTSLFTSFHPEAHQVLNRHCRLSVEATTLAKLFRECGFRTAAFSANPYVSRHYGLDNGFLEFEEIFAHYDVTIEHVVSVPAEHVTRRVIEWIGSNAGDRFFLFIHYLQPHNPYESPVTDARPRVSYSGPVRGDAETLLAIDSGKILLGTEDLAFLKGLYDQNLSYVDAEITEFIEELRSIGLLEKSLFVLLSDHGEAFGEHGRFLHNSTVYDEMIHIPLILRFPAPCAKVGRIQSLVEIVDLLPSLCEIFKIHTRNIVQGMSFLPLLRQSFFRFLKKKWVFAQTDGAYMIRSADRKLIKNRNDTWELYDLVNDKEERCNIYEKSMIEAKELCGKLEVWLKTQASIRSKIHLCEELVEKEQEMMAKKLKGLGYLG